MSRLSKVFAINREGLDVSRGFEVLAMLALPFVVLTALGQQEYLLSVVFGVLFVALSDPGGRWAVRVRSIVWVAAAGTLVTAFGFAIGNSAWEIVVVASVIVTLLFGLMMRLGVHAFVAALLVNTWFFVALILPADFEASHVSTSAWAQALAWLGGSAYWVVVAVVVWLIRHRRPAASRFPEIPTDNTPKKLTPPLVLFAVIRAVAVGISVAIPFGLNLPNADWMPIATILAMKPSLAESALFAEQRLAGAILGALTAALLLFTIDNKYVLVPAIIIFCGLAVSIHGVNYALYCAAVAAAVLIGSNLSHPHNLGDEGRRVLYTFIGVGIAVVVMLLANLLKRRTPATAHN